MRTPARLSRFFALFVIYFGLSYYARGASRAPRKYRTVMNYQKLLDNEIQQIQSGGRVPSLLLHACCGPCSSYVLEYLSRHFNITLLFYNPNIYPQAEYKKRLDTLRKLLAGAEAANPVELIASSRRGEDFDAIAAGLEDEPENGARCAKCFALRLRETARTAREMRADFFCTTLTVGPRKDAQVINSIGEALGAEYGVMWLPADFKKNDGYRRSVSLSREYGLYRQDYCGCKYSLRDKSGAAREERHG